MHSNAVLIRRYRPQKPKERITFLKGGFQSKEKTLSSYQNFPKICVVKL